MNDSAQAGLFVSWAPFSRRTETLARRFDLDLHFVSTPWPKKPLAVPLKYPWQAAATARLLSSARHGELWVMDPPAPLVAMAGVSARGRRVSLVVDMHTVAFYAREWGLLRPLELSALRAAAAVVVTNDALAEKVLSWGARAFVLPDPMPKPPDGPAEAVDPNLVTVVATYSKDEPLELLPGVARSLPGLRFAVTGAPRGDLGGWPANLTPTGFMSDEDYWRQLARSAVVVVLTTRPDTLLSGGYEALVLGRPLVTSDHAVLRDYFGDAAVYASSTGASLRDAVAAAVAGGAGLAEALCALRAVRQSEWERAARRLGAAVGRPG